MSKPAPVFSLRLSPVLYAACLHYATDSGDSIQMWIQKVLAQHVGHDALAIAAHEELSGKKILHWPSLPEDAQ